MYKLMKRMQGVLLDKYGIQLRKTDVRRSENITLDINRNYGSEQRRILICYLDYGRTMYALRHNPSHTNYQELCQIIRVLIEMDFRIDVCGCSNSQAVNELPKDYYDYIFGLGEVFWKAAQYNPKAFLLLYMTENPYYVSRQRENERLQYFFERTGKRLEFSRTGNYYKDADEEKADAIICLGEEKYYNKLQKPVMRVFPSAFKNPEFKDIRQPREKTNFLVFGVKGFVHKGNDILIEVFQKHKEWKLYMCGADIEKECANIGYKLPANIIDCGFVDAASQKFCDIAASCTFILLPSCSEGMSTGLMTCMRHGLIPITMHGTGMDKLEEYCLFFDNYFIASIEQKLAEVTAMGNEECEALSSRIYEYANREFTIEKYTENIRNALKKLLI